MHLENYKATLCEEVVERLGNSDRPIKEEGFMALRCQVAKQRLKSEVLREVDHGFSNYVPLLPLYDFDFFDGKEKPLLARPKLSDVRHLAFIDLLSHLDSEELSYFVDKPGLTAWSKGCLVTIKEDLSLGAFGMAGLDRQYFNQIKAIARQRWTPNRAEWVLYILLPGGKVPPVSPWRFVHNKLTPEAIDRFYASLCIAIMGIPILILVMLIIFGSVSFIKDALEMRDYVPQKGNQFVGECIDEGLDSSEKD